MSVSADSGMEAITDTSSNLASSSSTPPTTIADSASIHSDTPKHDVITVADDAADAEALIPTPVARSRRARSSAPVYNLSQLSGTAGHGKRRAKGDIVSERRRRTISGDTLIDDPGASQQSLTTMAVRDGIDALDLQWSPGRLNTPRTRRQLRESPRSLRTASRTSRAPVAALSAKLNAMSKRGRKAVDKSVTKMSRELRRLQDTKEFSHIDEQPVVHTVWSNGKYVDPTEVPAAPARKKAKVEEPEEKEAPKEPSEPVTNVKKNRTKKYLNKGLYAGQDAPKDPLKGLTLAERKKLAQIPELKPSGRINKAMPQPMFTGIRTLLTGRDFKLPYHICNPLPPGQPKPDEWKKMTKSMRHLDFLFFFFFVNARAHVC
jgi:histone-lysine N-methyltransferase ASH1L